MMFSNKRAGTLNTGRDMSIDCLKGLAILGVVIIHSTFAEKHLLLNQLLDVFFKFGVPLFIFISGFFVFKKKKDIEQNFLKYLVRRFEIVGIPYLLMTILISLATGSGLKALIRMLVTGTASVPFYYIIVIFQFYLLSKLILHLYERHYKFLIAISVLAVMLYSALFYLQLYKFGEIVLPYFMWQFPNYLLWFVLGIEFAARGPVYARIANMKSMYYLLLLMIGFLACSSEIYSLVLNNYQDGDYIAATTILWSAVAIISFWRFKDKLVHPVLYYLGMYSFGIFLIHKPLQDLYFNYFQYPRIPELALVYTAVTLAICVPILLVLNKVRTLVKVTPR
jgi:probable poly-beta-1,6-N-acetyl-D-glucosamine export protein